MYLFLFIYTKSNIHLVFYSGENLIYWAVKLSDWLWSCLYQLAKQYYIIFNANNMIINILTMSAQLHWELLLYHKRFWLHGKEAKTKNNRFKSKIIWNSVTWLTINNPHKCSFVQWQTSTERCFLRNVSPKHLSDELLNFSLSLLWENPKTRWAWLNIAEHHVPRLPVQVTVRSGKEKRWNVSGCTRKWRLSQQNWADVTVQRGDVTTRSQQSEYYVVAQRYQRHYW